MKLTAKYITENSAHFESVKKLWRDNSRTLGFFPDGAFRDYAADECILVAEYQKKLLDIYFSEKLKVTISIHMQQLFICALAQNYEKRG